MRSAGTALLVFITLSALLVGVPASVDAPAAAAVAPQAAASRVAAMPSMGGIDSRLAQFQGGHVVNIYYYSGEVTGSNPLQTHDFRRLKSSEMAEITYAMTNEGTFYDSTVRFGSGNGEPSSHSSGNARVGSTVATTIRPETTPDWTLRDYGFSQTALNANYVYVEQIGRDTSYEIVVKIIERNDWITDRLINYGGPSWDEPTGLCHGTLRGGNQRSDNASDWQYFNVTVAGGGTMSFTGQAFSVLNTAAVRMEIIDASPAETITGLAFEGVLRDDAFRLTNGTWTNPSPDPVELTLRMSSRFHDVIKHEYEVSLTPDPGCTYDLTHPDDPCRDGIDGYTVCLEYRSDNEFPYSVAEADVYVRLVVLDAAKQVVDVPTQIGIQSGPSVGASLTCWFVGQDGEQSTCDGATDGVPYEFSYEPTTPPAPTDNIDEIVVRLDIDGDGVFDGVADHQYTFDREIKRPAVVLALGDSFSAGETGYWSPYFGLAGCHQYVFAYAIQLDLLGSGRGTLYHDKYRTPAPDFRACTGGRTFNVVEADPLPSGSAPSPGRIVLTDEESLTDANGPSPVVKERGYDRQLENQPVASDTDMVVLTIGGNDAQFAELISACLANFNCGKFGDQTYVDEVLQRTITRINIVIDDIQDNAPDAEIFLLGYPLLFEGPCSLFNTVGITAGEYELLRSNQVQFDADALAAATAQGVHYVSVQDGFAGGAVCGNGDDLVRGLHIEMPPPEITEPLFWDAAYEVLQREFPQTEVIETIKSHVSPGSFHPTNLGQFRYAQILEEYVFDWVYAGNPVNDAGVPIFDSGGAGGGQAHLGASAGSAIAASYGSYRAQASSDPHGRLEFSSPSAACAGTGALVSGDTINVVGFGWASGETISFTIGNENTTGTGSATADADGYAAISLPVPAITGDAVVMQILAEGLNDAGETLTSQSRVFIAGPAQWPCPLNDAATAPNAAVLIDVLDNDDQGAALDSSSLTISIQATGGVASIDASGQVLYTPDVHFAGEDEFEYEVCSTAGLCSSALVEVTVDRGCTITGTDEDDVLVGTPGDDIICGLDGNDKIDGGGGNDIIYGGGGNDWIVGGEGEDTVRAGDGHDLIGGGLGADDIDGGEGADDIAFGGDNTVVPDPEDDIIGIPEAPEPADDEAYVMAGVDTIVDVLGNDTDPNGDIDPASLTIATPPATGTANVVGETIVFTAGGSFSGSETITYEICDASLLCSTATITVNLGFCNDLPITVDLNNAASPPPTTGDDVIIGTPGNDIILALAGDDVVCGGDGDDVLAGNSGADILLGDEGDDTIYGGPDIDTIFGGEGDDQLQGNEDADVIFGDEGEDIIAGNSGADTLVGGDDDDVIYGGAQDDQITGGAGADILLGALGDDMIDGDAGADLISGNAGADIINGGSEDDVIYGVGGADVINGGDGSDTILGGLDNDTISGDAGADLISGNDGDDIINGGTEDDTMYGVDGADTINGGDDDDEILGGSGADVITGGAGDDALSGNAGDDDIDGGDGIDTIFGGDDNDSLVGGPGVDTILGGTGDDTISAEGDGSADTVSGNAHVNGDTCTADPIDVVYLCNP